MDLRKKVEHRFKRVIMECESTALFGSLPEKINLELVAKVKDKVELPSCIAASYVDDENWLVVTLSSVILNNGGELKKIPLEELVEAKLDLAINKKAGFNSNKGFNIISLIQKDGREIYAQVEGGSGLEAMLSIIVELIQTAKLNTI